MVVLKDTSLCAIVRDEKMNPAGGIKRFIESHVPYVEEAVIVDTGSVDGTREILEELAFVYKNLKVYDHPFQGYADARNFSLKKTNCEWNLVLDADELLTHEKPLDSFKEIDCIIRVHSNNVYHMDFDNILPDGQLGNVPFWGERLFRKGSMKFVDEVFERAKYNDWPNIVRSTVILHFLPEYNSLKIKNNKWYALLKAKFFYNAKINDIAPSKTPGFSDWKSYNPQRDNYL